jgi:hypothetical protein
MRALKCSILKTFGVHGPSFKMVRFHAARLRISTVVIVWLIQRLCAKPAGQVARALSAEQYSP